MDDESLSSILDNESAPEAPKAPVAEVKDEKPPVEAPPEQKPETAAPSAVKEPEKAQPEEKRPLTAQEHAALVALKAKTKELERELAEARKGQPQEKPDFWADPEKAVEKTVEERAQKAVAPLRERFFKASIEKAAASHTDFQTAVDAFEKLVEANPTLAREFSESEDPGEFIYQVATNTPENREKAIGEMRTQLASLVESNKALQAELEALKTGKAQLAQVPKSLNNVPSGAPPKAQDTDEEDIAQIVRFKTG